MTLTITSPAKVSGANRYGPTVLMFRDGVAEVDDISPGLRDYLISRGYVIDAGEEPDVEPSSDPGEPTLLAEGGDPADFTVEQVLAYLFPDDGEPPTSEERARVIDAESAGKARSTLLAAIDKAAGESAAGKDSA